MILIGMFDSPFVRRVAVSMNLLKLPFEHRNWSVGKDFELIRQFNPLGRVPTLVQADGETLIESAAILDFLDETVGPERALLPHSGDLRREALRVIAIAIGGAEKGVTQVYETAFRPPEKRYRPWVERCHNQTHAALAELDRLCQVRGDKWLVGNRITQADITATCVYTFLSDALGINRDSLAYPALGAVAARCEALPEFSSVKADWFAPADS
ncbi:MAG TPA: glutathione S-transferase family protein [Steroidobacteraceae bacterium]|jgi:glutathione S-transferase|nr:glutathione S-transferase family protein [Steroidobacteraceae bacterium]